MADNESILGVVIDPDKAESGSKRVNSALDAMESKGSNFAQKFDKVIGGTFSKFAATSSNTFDKLQSSASNAFDNLSKSSKNGAESMVKQYTNAVKSIQSQLDKLNRAQLDTSKAALFQGSRLPTQSVSYDGAARMAKIEFENARKAQQEFDAQMNAYWSGFKARAALLKATPSGLESAAAEANKLYNNIMSNLGKVPGATSKIWGQVSTGAKVAFSSVQANASIAATGIKSSFQKAWNAIKAGYDKISGGGSGGSGGGMFSGLGGWFAGAGIYIAVDQFIDKLVDANNTYNSFIATLKAGKLTGEQASEEYQYLLNLANSMGVEFSSLTRSYAKFTAATMDSALAGKAAKEIFESIVTVSTVLHSKGYDTERMFYAITQSISKGRIYREELVQQLAEKLPGAMNLAAKSMGMNIKDLNKALTDGTLDVSEFWLKFSQGLKQAYGGAAAEAAKMVEANLNRLKNAVEVAFINIGQSGAIKGFITLIQSLTNVINSITSSSTYFGETVGNTFEMIASWINALSPRDLDSVMQGLTGIFDAFILSTKVFVESISDISGSKSTFIDFAEAASSALLTLAGIMADTVNTFKLLFMYMNKPVEPQTKSMPGLMAQRSDPNYKNKSPAQIRAYEQSVKDQFNSDYATYQKELKLYDTKIEKAWDNVGSGMENADKNQRKMAEVYDRMRKQNLSVSDVPFSQLKQAEISVPGVLSKTEFDDLLDKIKGDPNYNPGTGKGDKKAEREKLSVMKAYWNEREQQIKQLAKMQIDESNILANQNPLYEYNVRLEKEKIAADERLMKLAPEFKEKLMDNARALDAQAISLENVRAVMTDYMSTYQQLITNQDQINQLNSGGLKQFTEEDQERRSTMFGGSNQYMSDATKKQLIETARLRDSSNVDLAAAQMNRDMSEQIILMLQRNELIGMGNNLTQLQSQYQQIDNDIRLKTIGLAADQIAKFKAIGDEQKRLLEIESFNNLKKNMEFELSEQIRELEFRNRLIGLTAVEQAKLNEQFRIESMIRRETIGMTDQQKQKYEELANAIKDKLTKSIQDNADIQRSVITGFRNGIAQYIDEITNYAAQAQNSIMGLFKTLEDSLVEFITTGKLSLKDFLSQIKQDIARAFVRENIMKPITSIFKDIFAGATGGSNSSTSGSGSITSMLGTIKDMFTGSSTNSFQSNLLGSIGSKVGAIGQLFGSSAISEFASGLSGKAMGTVAGMGPTIAGSATGLGSLSGSMWSRAGNFMGNYGGYVSAAIQAFSGNLKGAAFTAAGAAIGSIIPGVGTVIGGMIGSAVGSLFGSKPKTKKYSSSVTANYTNGQFSSSSQNGVAGYGKALGADDAISNTLEGYSKMMGNLMKSFGLGDSVSSSMQMFQRSSSKTRAWGYFGASAGGGSTSFSSGDTAFRGADAAQQAFNALLAKIFTQGVTDVVATSKLPQGIKALFADLTDRTVITNMVMASISLSDAQDVLMKQYGLTASNAGLVAKATGLADQALVDFVNTLTNTALSSQTIGDAMVRQRDLLTETLGGKEVGNFEGLSDFDKWLKTLDTSTALGQEQFATFFQQRDNIANYLKSFGEIKSSLDSVLYDFMTPSEQLAYNQDQLGKIFEQLNMEVPTSRDELKEWMKNLDLSTASGLNAAAAASTIAQLFDLITGDLIANAQDLSEQYYTTRADYESAVQAASSGESPTPYIKTQTVLLNDLVGEMESMKEANVTMQAYLRTLSENAAKQQRILDEWDRRGMPLEREDQ